MDKSLSYTVLGKGTPVVFLHGFLENKNMWDFLQYSDYNNIKYILIDLPGHGNSPNYSDVHTIPFMAQKVEEILEKEKIQKYHLVGHSMGGYVSLALAEKSPDKMKSLGLFFSSPFEDSAAKKTQRIKSAEFVKINKEEFVRLGVRGLFNPNKIKELQPQIQQAYDMAIKTSTQGISAALLGMSERKDTSQVLLRKDIPIFWIFGEYDHAIDKEKIDAFLFKKDYILEYELPIGHMGHLEAPQICNTIIHQFYKDL